MNCPVCDQPVSEESAWQSISNKDVTYHWTCADQVLVQYATLDPKEVFAEAVGTPKITTAGKKAWVEMKKYLGGK